MSLYNLTITNLKRHLKSPKSLLLIISIPILFNLFLSANTNSLLINNKIGVVNLDTNKSDISSNLITLMNNTENISAQRYDTKTDGVKALIEGNILALYIIPNDFSTLLLNNNTPIIETLLVEKTGTSDTINIVINNYISNILKGNLLTIVPENSIQVDSKLSPDNLKLFVASQITLLCYFMFLVNLIFSCDIIEMKKFKVLGRMLYTPHSKRKILMSLYLTHFLLQCFISSITIIITKIFFAHLELNLPIALCYINAIAFLSTAFNIFIIKLVKTESLVSAFTVAFVFINYFSAMAGTGLFTELATDNKIIHILANFSPFYWCLTGVNTNTIFPNILIILALGVFFLTAGSFDINTLLDA